MSKSTDDTNELESYGVWVKHPSNSVEETSLDDLTTETSDDLDLPDFDDSDFSDMFKDDDNKADTAENFMDDDNTTLSVDELANITSSADAIEEVPAESIEEQTDTNVDSDDTFDISFDEIPDMNDLNVSEDSVEEEKTEEPAEEEISLEDFGFSDVDENSDTNTEPAETEISSSGDEEVSLDDFLDEGFSDESVASGNNGFAADEVKSIPDSSASEEISLDDFGFSDIEEKAPEEKVEEEPDEAPLDMNLNFDDSVDSIETEENVSVESEFDLDNVEETAVEDVKTEEVSLDDFASDSSDLATESVDLSDFGIDADAEETPVTQDVTSEKSKETKVDYDLSVGVANSAAPVVTEIEDKGEVVEDIQEVQEAEPAQTASDSTSISNALLQQIVNDLSGLKNEINQLKSNLEEIKTSGFTAETKPAEEAVNEDISLEPEKEESGFFSDDDGDDTIALSFDELDNIMNTAGLSDETEAAEAPQVEEPVVDDNLFVEPETAETSVEIESEDLPESVEFEESENAAEENSFVPEEETAGLEDEDLPSEISIPKYEEKESFEEPVTEANQETAEEITESNEEISEPVAEEVAVEDSVDSIFVDSEKTEEPNFDIGEELSNDFVEEEPVVEEKTDEPLITEESEPAMEETESVDFAETTTEDTNDMDSIFVEPEGENNEAEPVIEESVSEVEEESPAPFEENSDAIIDVTLDDSDIINPETISDEDVVSTDDFITETTEPENNDIDSVDNIFDGLDTVETTENEEPVIEETSVELPEEASEEITEEQVVEESEVPTVDSVLAKNDEETTENAAESESTTEANDFDPFVSTSTSDVTESDINFLTSGEKPEDSEKNTANEELKKDIKSVLIYMDQLLENLPEDKIIEFAKSDEFTTYKKLFSELGLS